MRDSCASALAKGNLAYLSFLGILLHGGIQHQVHVHLKSPAYAQSSIILARHVFRQNDHIPREMLTAASKLIPPTQVAVRRLQYMRATSLFWEAQQIVGHVDLFQGVGCLTFQIYSAFTATIATYSQLDINHNTPSESRQSNIRTI